MSWRIEVRHTTDYQYENEVVASYNEVRLTPQATAWKEKRLLEAHRPGYQGVDSHCCNGDPTSLS